MKQIITYHFSIKLLSIASAVMWLVGRSFFCEEFEFSYELAVSLCVATAIVLMLPVGGENVRTSFRFALGLLGLSVIMCLSLMQSALAVPVFLTGVYVYLELMAIRKYDKVRALFKNDQVWKSVEEDARCVYVRLFSLNCAIVLLSRLVGYGTLLSATLLLALYLILFLRSYLGRTFFIGETKEQMIKNIVKGTLRPISMASADEEDTARMGKLYDRVVRLMEERRPYLDEEFSLPDMASAVFSNKAYLSKAINVFSGRNFRQFINYYRINYSIDLMKKDPHLRITELASMSGFHNVVTYNMAFKLNTNETPSECLTRIRLKSEERLPSYGVLEH